MSFDSHQRRREREAHKVATLEELDKRVPASFDSMTSGEVFDATQKELFPDFEAGKQGSYPFNAFHIQALKEEAMDIAAKLVTQVDGKGDMVNMPSHYANFKIEPIRFSAENNLNVFQMNISKYIVRAPHKHKDGGKQDIRKAIRYAVMFYKFIVGDPDWWKPYSPAFIAALDKELERHGQ